MTRVLTVIVASSVGVTLSLVTLAISALSVVVIATVDGLTLGIKREGNVEVLHAGFETVAAVVGVNAVDLWGSGGEGLGSVGLGRSKRHAENVLHGPEQRLVRRLLQVAPRKLHALACRQHFATVCQLCKVVNNSLGSNYP